MKYFFILFWMIFGLCYNSLAQSEQNISSQIDSSFQANLNIKEKKNRPSIIGVPIITYSPETSVTFGIGSITYVTFYKDSITRSSNLFLVAMYTLKKQMSIALKSTYYIKQNKLSITPEIVYQYFPNRFYGIGNNVDDTYENYQSNEFKLKLIPRFKLYKSLYGSLNYVYRYNKLSSVSQSGKFVQYNALGLGKTFISGTEASIMYDTRNDDSYPTTGEFIELASSNFGGAFQGNFSFNEYKLDVRKYWEPFYKNKELIALQYQIYLTKGTLPYYYLPKIGGDSNSRGLYDGKYRDRNKMQFQAELRSRLFWRFRLVGFYSSAFIANELKNFQLSNIKQTFGAGLRYKVFSNRNVHVRIDGGFGHKSWGMYIQIAEAF